MELYLSRICRQPILYLHASCSSRFREPPFWRHESLQPQEEYCIESTAGVAEPDSGSHDENLRLGGEGNEEDEEGG